MQNSGKTANCMGYDLDFNMDISAEKLKIGVSVKRKNRKRNP